MKQNIGYLLKEHRTKLNLSLEEVSDIIKVRTKYLTILEEDLDERETPPPVYMLGYLKIYANFIGLDGKQIIEQISFYAKQSDISMNHLEHIKTNPSRNILIFSLIFMIILLILWSCEII